MNRTMRTTTVAIVGILTLLFGFSVTTTAQVTVVNSPITGMVVVDRSPPVGQERFDYFPGTFGDPANPEQIPLEWELSFQNDGTAPVTVSYDDDVTDGENGTQLDLICPPTMLPAGANVVTCDVATGRLTVDNITIPPCGRVLMRFQTVLNDPQNAGLDEARENVRKRWERFSNNLDEVGELEIQELFLSTLARMYDPHSVYFSADTLEDFSISMRLSLVGIGALLSQEDGYCVVKELIPGGPASLSKQLDPNDKIVGVAQGNEESVDVIGMSLRKIVNQIRGDKGSEVRLTILPGDAVDSSVRRELTLVRDVVQLNATRAKAEIYEAQPQDRNKYANNFFSWVYDVNGDGDNDVFTVGFPGTPAYVYENPGEGNYDTLWNKHQVFDWVSNESPYFDQLLGDDTPELVCTRDGRFGYATLPNNKTFDAWTFHPVS